MSRVALSAMANTCGGNSPSDLPLYFLIVCFEYNSLISLYGLIAIRMLATKVWNGDARTLKEENFQTCQRTYIDFIFEISIFDIMQQRRFVKEH
jgi:hypothetical protein